MSLQWIVLDAAVLAGVMRNSNAVLAGVMRNSKRFDRPCHARLYQTAPRDVRRVDARDLIALVTRGCI